MEGRSVTVDQAAAVDTTADPSSCSQLLSDRLDRVEQIHRQLRDPLLVDAVSEVGQAIVGALTSGGTLVMFGNGGSAVDAGHIVAEFVGRCTRERGPLAAINLADATANVTAIGNDYGYDAVFERQVHALARPGDVVIGISCSGNSANVHRGLAAAREVGAYAVGLTGADGGKMDQFADLVLRAPAEEIGRAQEVHKLWGHVWAEWAEVAIFGSSTR